MSLILHMPTEFPSQLFFDDLFLIESENTFSFYIIHRHDTQW